MSLLLNRRSRNRTYPLKHRLIVLLLVSSITPLILLGAISYFSMTSMLNNKAEVGVRNHLHQVRLSLENMLSQLNHASQQLALDGRVGQNLEHYLSADLYAKKQIRDEIHNQLSLIHFTNPTLGLIFYYLGSENQSLFENYSLFEAPDMDELPTLFRYNELTYSGPHRSLNPIDGNQVLSILRKVELLDRDDVYVYIETNFKLAESIIRSEQFGEELIFVIVDGDGRIVYSDYQVDFPVGTHYASTDGSKRDSYYSFEESSNQSWKVVAAIPSGIYRYELNRWIRQFVIAAVLTLAVSGLIAWLIWRSMYRPLWLLNHDIRSVRSNTQVTPQRRSEIAEFDVIYREFADMRHRISELITEVEQKEKFKSLLEVEKLMIQINPHFIHNSLDTVRWLALSNGQMEIVRLVSTLNKLLHYNLGKGGQASIRDEIEALKTYVELQGIRYAFEFDVQIHADARALELPIPRFILQPLVENSLYHGVGDKGVIEVHVDQDGDSHIRIRVKDDGEGMTEEEITRLLREDSITRKQAGLGIGLDYVYRMIKHHFGRGAGFHIMSTPGEGTTITLRLPVVPTEGGNQHV